MTESKTIIILSLRQLLLTKFVFLSTSASIYSSSSKVFLTKLDASSISIFINSIVLFYISLIFSKNYLLLLLINITSPFLWFSISL